MTPRPSAQSATSRPDHNRDEIIEAFKKMGASVSKLAPVDLIVGFPDRTFLVEVKDGSKSPSRQKLTKAEAMFIKSWRGEISIVRSVEDALAIARPHANDVTLERCREISEEIAKIRNTPAGRLADEGKVKR